jgi:uncharacterized protein YndB with AHSA1/START domain
VTTPTITADQCTLQTLEIHQEVLIAATPAVSFQALLEELGPGSVGPDGTPFPMKLEPWPGGRWYRDRGEAGGFQYGHLWGHVQVIKAPVLLELTGPMPMSYPAINHVQYRLQPEGSSTRLTLVHRAMGSFPTETYQQLKNGMPDGWAHGLNRVKLVAERKANS